MAKFVCSVCGYVHDGVDAPHNCPICDAPSEKLICDSGAITEEDNHAIKDEDFEVYKIIQSKGVDRAAEWYKENNFCSIDEAREIVTLIRNRYEAPIQINEKGGRDNYMKYLLIFGVLITIILICWFVSSNSSNTEKIDDSAKITSIADSSEVEVDIKSEEYIKKYMEENLNRAINEREDYAVAKYFTKEFINLYKEVEICEKKYTEEGDVGFWDFDFWTGGQDGELERVSVLDVKAINQNSATIIVQYLIKFGQYDESKSSTEFNLLLEEGEWKVDDFNSYKWRFKNFIDESTSIQEVIVVDSAAAIAADSVR